MDINSNIIKDVLKDYNDDNNEITYNYGEIGTVLNSSLQCLINVNKETILSAEDIYAVCMECLYYLTDMKMEKDKKDKGVSTDNADINDTESLINNFFSKDLVDTLESSEPYKWIPKALEGVLQASYEIFEEAKQYYYTYDFHSKQDISMVKRLFSKIVDAREELSTLQCVYRSHADIMRIYEQELSESQLDIDLITTGNKLMLSLRLADYIETHYTGEASKGVDFSLENPFSMPDKLF